jgi:hypothetical protein
MSKLLNLFPWRRDRLERDLDRELRYHVDRRIEDLMKAGLSEPEARRQASVELGGVPQVQEAVRDTWISRWLEALLWDVRYSVRSLTRSWGFALGAGAVLALAQPVPSRALERGRAPLSRTCAIPPSSSHIPRNVPSTSC